LKIIYLVHQFYPEFQSGTEKFVYNNALMAQKSRNKVKVITYSFYNDSYYEQVDDGILSREFVYKGIPVIAFKYKNQPIDLHIALENESSYRFAKKIVDVESPDIIHVGHPMRVHEFIRVAKEKNIPYLLTLTDFFLICPKVILAPNNNSLCSGPQRGTACHTLCKEFTDDFIGKRLNDAEVVLNNAKQIISPSKFGANIFKHEFNKLNIHVINHGMRYKYIKQNNRIYHKEEKLVFGYAGTLAYHKGVHVLLKAFSSIDNKNIKLLIYGSGDEGYVNKLKEIVGNDNRVTFCGTYSPEQVGDIFTGIDVAIVPSVCYESFPLVLHEALASNVPVIASGLGGMAEQIRDGFNGFTFEPGVSEDLIKKMDLIISDAFILNKIKENIKNKMTILTVEQEAYSYLKIYNNLYQA